MYCNRPDTFSSHNFTSSLRTKHPELYWLQSHRQLAALRHANSLFQSQFSTQCHLVLPLAIYYILSSP